MKREEIPRVGIRITRKQADLVSRRTRPFVHGSTHLSIEHLMREAYLQGIRDAVQVLAPTQ